MKHSNKLEFTVYGIFCSFSAVALYYSWKLGLGGIGELGPGLLPFVANLCILLLGLLLLLFTIFRRGQVARPTTPSMGYRAWGRVFALLLSLAIWPFLVNTIGYIFASFLVSLGTAKAMGYKGWFQPLILGACISLGIWFIFGFMFSVDLPAGFSS